MECFMRTEKCRSRFLTYEQQLVKLRDEKHIVIADEAGTLCKLQQVGYYSLVSSTCRAR